MGTIVTYNVGGFDPEKPNDNILEIKETDKDIIPISENTNIELIANTLSQLPKDILDSLMQALGIGQNNE